MAPASSTTPSLRKAEAEPLLRRDTHWSLLERIFSNDQAVFRLNAKSEKRVTFGELYYLDWLSSSKLSKTLKEKFIADKQATLKVCMAALLVNVGRINTTLVFTPTQSRTFNCLPCVQAYEPGGKLLQDAPRLKSLLKGSCEGPRAPPTWEALKALQASASPKPLTNPINLIFLMTTPEATSVKAEHFSDSDLEFYHLFSKSDLTTDSRARAFLWLCYHYIETNGTLEEALTNPFGQPEAGLLVPTLVPCDEGAIAAENIDTPEELEYAEFAVRQRRLYLENAVLKVEQSKQDAASKETAKDGEIPVEEQAASEDIKVEGEETPAAEKLKTLENTPLDKLKKASRPPTKRPNRSKASPRTPVVLGEDGQPIAEPTRRSSRKVKRKTYDSMGSSEGEGEGGEERRQKRSQHDGDRAVGPAAQAAQEEWAKKVATRQQQMLSHALRRKHKYHLHKRQKQSAIQREFAAMQNFEGGTFLGADDMEALFEPLDDFDTLLQYQVQHNHVNSANGGGDVGMTTGHVVANLMTPIAAANGALAAEQNPSMISGPVKRDLQQATAFAWREDWGEEAGRLGRALQYALGKVNGAYGAASKSEQQTDATMPPSFKIRLKF
ncbi:hypothetical protein BCR37DRAFT_398518 [Protomyces lactucae-debilis]|uniref:Ino eighty subunit 1 n=1 Tax=Protomyces lactucae-debilis TaxID=2754530 RepID=A0A1Y2FF54_PROLT|nr:uncharacterized protein BCR37DRAFT_398518 [Protomyces lactucae-debilis]ORY82541.1 hypothetical protein BCR37DRAFT_398518 [Protomyces lactucae-debilis]